MNSKATHTGRPKSRSCNGSYTGRGVGGRNRCASCRATVSQARAKCSPRSRDEGLVCTPSLSIRRVTDVEINFSPPLAMCGVGTAV